MYVPSVTFNDKRLALANKGKYLGCMVSSNFLDKEYIKNEIRNTYAIGNLIIQHFQHCSSDVKLQDVLYYLLLCCFVPLPRHDILLIAHNKISASIRRPMNFSAATLFISVNVKNFSFQMCKLVNSVTNIICSSENCLALTMFNSGYFTKCKLKGEWDRVWFV